MADPVAEAEKRHALAVIARSTAEAWAVAAVDKTTIGPSWWRRHATMAVGLYGHTIAQEHSALDDLRTAYLGAFRAAQ